MLVVNLNPRYMTNPEESHAYLAKELQLPAYYGHNLDALYDVLTDISIDTKVKISHTITDQSHLGSYGDTLIQVFQDASDENPPLTLLVE